MLQHQNTQISACSGNADKEAERIATVNKQNNDDKTVQTQKGKKQQ